MIYLYSFTFLEDKQDSRLPTRPNSLCLNRRLIRLISDKTLGNS